MEKDSETMKPIQVLRNNKETEINFSRLHLNKYLKNKSFLFSEVTTAD